MVVLKVYKPSYRKMVMKILLRVDQSKMMLKKVKTFKLFIYLFS